MQYVLAMSFEYFRYKRDATVRIYADDHLVDEIYLNDDIKLRVTDMSNPTLDNIHGPYNHCKIRFFPEKLFIFQIDEKFLRSHIVIEVLNDNNNNTNGFITKWSWLRFNFVYLIPCFFMEAKNWKMLNRFRSEDDIISRWPDVPFDHITFVYTNNKQSDPYFFLNQRGGNFAVKIPLSKKHKIIHLGKPAPGRVILNMILAKILDAFGTLNKST